MFPSFSNQTKKETKNLDCMSLTYKSHKSLAYHSGIRDENPGVNFGSETRFSGANPHSSVKSWGKIFLTDPGKPYTPRESAQRKRLILVAVQMTGANPMGLGRRYAGFI